MKYILIFFLFFSVFAKEQRMSDIKPVTMYYIDLEPGFCDDDCLNELLQQDMIASFLARFDRLRVTSLELLDKYLKIYYYTPDMVLNDNLKIAVILPQKIIKSYSDSVTKSLISYALKYDLNVDLKFINSDDESPENIQKALDEARKDSIKYFIAPLTANGVILINKLAYPNETFFLPSVHSSLFKLNNPNFVFGGVDYQAQIKSLFEFANNKISAFSDGSFTGNSLNNYVKNISKNSVYEVEMLAKNIKLEEYFNNFSYINNSSIFLNLSLIKASLIATQLKIFEIEPFALLSTQINYNPKFLQLVKTSDREKFYIANSIFLDDDSLSSINALFGIDLRYNWIGYSSSVGLDYIYSLATGKNRKFDQEIIDNQVIYGVDILKTDEYNFIKTNDLSDYNY
ncbi:hypothetical protein CPIN18020_0756 [Campylobacter pinnipediorum subsp. caledonicus]|uniref:hypothetical protein n=1 Tax=Campylobacter pinnipediorum TaxID=1965231 RepID=UPI0009959EA9|nr:hypothetical protein [Campylobacter pinnipediorum]AQW85965.1 hypothetical protein CPIN18020_0756 [Campylobacter pinnipediorum subsp. caledonicus]